jgi:hypothetical protein
MSDPDLVEEVDSRVDGIDQTTSLNELSALIRADKYIHPNKTLSVDTFVNLLLLTPDLEEGTIVFLEEYNGPVILISGLWRNFSGTELPPQDEP